MTSECIFWPMCKHTNISSTNAARIGVHGSLRIGTPRDGTTYVQVLYRFNGRQTSTPLDDRRPDFIATICNSGSQLCQSREW